MAKGSCCLLQPWVRYLATVCLGLLLLVHVLPPRSIHGGLWIAHPRAHGGGGGGGGGSGRGHRGAIMPSSVKPDDVATRPMERYRVSKREGRAQVTANRTHDTSASGNSPQVLAPERVRLQFNSSSKAYKPMLWSKGLPPVQPSNVLKPCDQKVRLTRMREQCELYRQTGDPIANPAKLSESRTFRFMLVDEKHKTVYCEVPKAACTSWKSFLANITKKVKPEDQSRLFQLVHDTTYHPQIGFRFLDSYSPSERRYILRTYFKFLVVRNPYTRFLSAYENKFKGYFEQSLWYHEFMGKYIVRKYRKGFAKDAPIRGDDVKFDELAQMMANPNEQHSQRFDGHFWKMHATCHPCLVDYDYMAKVETMAHDSEVLIKKIVPTEDIQLPFFNKNENRVHERDYVRNAYQNLSDSTLTALSAVYESDMRVFGYEMDGERNINCNSADKGQPQCC